MSTLKLVDTPDEQKQLEELIEDTKPPIPETAKGLHYLLATPFRYAPYPNGSRFRRAGMTPGVFYASENVDTAMTEIAFYRYLFFAAAPEAELPVNATEYTAFSVKIRTGQMLDLTVAPLVKHRALWTSLTDYGPCQDFAEKSRAIGAQVLRYASVRDPQHGANAAILDPQAFAQKKPGAMQSWRMRINEKAASAICEAPKKTLSFLAAQFAADPRLNARR